MPLPHMISHAQNGEDVVLRRALHSKTSGLWVDIGYPSGGGRLALTSVFEIAA